MLKMFFEFGCHTPDSIFTMVCYDWDPNKAVVRAGEEVFIADPLIEWPASGEKQKLIDNEDSRFTFTYKFVYGSNLNADGATEDDDVMIVPAPAPSPSKKKKDESGIDLGLAIGILVAAIILAFCCGAACCIARRRKDAPVAEVDGMEMAEVTVIESKAIEVPPEYDIEATPAAAGTMI